MSNFYTDNESLRFHLNKPLMKKVVQLKERDFTDEKNFDYAPLNFEDAMENYDKVLEILGEIAAEIIEPNAASVDCEGPRLVDNRVYYAKGTEENLEALRKANLMGMTLPRTYGGLNFPTIVYCLSVEIIARADASLMNIYGLQDIGETIKEFASEDTKRKYLPRFASGEATGAMTLTEPDAGSDLQAVKLKATCDKKGKWKLNGVKRFITNGNADLSLVLARSEEGTSDARGLSTFLYERDETVTVRRIENKMGIHGSPTCELMFKDSPAILIGKRRFGLIKNVMALMNRARLGIGCQAIGLAEAAYREAFKYAEERKQFGQKVNRFPGVYEMITNMKIKIEAARTLLYETARFIDIYKELEEIQRTRDLSVSERKEMRRYRRRADIYTPLLKSIASEYCNQVVYDAVQIHGGPGFMKDFAVERMYRDARITSIYEGTTQMQVIATIKGINSGVFTETMNEYHEVEVSPEHEFLKKILRTMSDEFHQTVKMVDDAGDKEFTDYHSRRLTEMAGNIIIGYLLTFDANRNHKFKTLAELFLKTAQSENRMKFSYIRKSQIKDLSLYKKYAIKISKGSGLHI